MSYPTRGLAMLRGAQGVNVRSALSRVLTRETLTHLQQYVERMGATCDVATVAVDGGVHEIVLSLLHTPGITGPCRVRITIATEYPNG